MMPAFLIPLLSMSVPVFVNSGDVDDDTLSSSAATAGVQWQNDGDFAHLGDGGAGPTEWLSRGAAADYEIRFTESSGDALDVSSDALNTWLPLSSTRQVLIIQSAIGSKTWTGSYQIRLASNSAVVGSGNIQLDAERSL